jgi:hypothetical protein
MKIKFYLSKKQIISITFFLVIIFATIIGIYLHINKRNKVNLEADIQNYIVTEYFIEKKDDSSKIYEVRYYTRNKKSYLTLAEKDGVKINETVTEIKTKFTNEYVNFYLSNVINSKDKDLANVDDSGFIYRSKIDEIQEFLANEAKEGLIKFSYATPSYFECYIENKEGDIMRGLLLYNSDNKTGTLIYKQCNEGIIIPTVLDIVISLDGNEKQ